MVTNRGEMEMLSAVTVSPFSGMAWFSARRRELSVSSREKVSSQGPAATRSASPDQMLP